jgi:hypothetical protein
VTVNPEIGFVIMDFVSTLLIMVAIAIPLGAILG